MPAGHGARSDWSCVRQISCKCAATRRKPASEPGDDGGLARCRLFGRAVRCVVLDPGRAGEQRFRVGMPGIVEQCVHVRMLHDVLVHDHHLASHGGDDAEVMRHEQHGRIHLLLKIAQQAEDFCLDRDVERGRGFVRDDDLGRTFNAEDARAR